MWNICFKSIFVASFKHMHAYEHDSNIMYRSLNTCVCSLDTPAKFTYSCYFCILKNKKTDIKTTDTLNTVRVEIYMWVQTEIN